METPLSRPIGRLDRLPRVRAARPGRRVTIALLVFLAAGLVSALAFRASYPGMASGMWNQMRYGTVEENRNLWACIDYWLAFMEKLRLDPETGIYNFRLTPDQGLNDFDAG